MAARRKRQGAPSRPRGMGKAAAAPAQKGAQPAAAARTRVIPDAVAGRMVRRIAVATGIPTLLGMSVFVVSYLLVSRAGVDVPPGLTLLISGLFFLLGLVGLSYGVLSASWESEAGSLLGAEQIGLNLSRLRASVRAMRQGPGPSSPG